MPVGPWMLEPWRLSCVFAGSMMGLQSFSAEELFASGAKGILSLKWLEQFNDMCERRKDHLRSEKDTDCADDARAGGEHACPVREHHHDKYGSVLHPKGSSKNTRAL